MSVVGRHPRRIAAEGLLACVLTAWVVKLVQVGRDVERAREFWTQPQGEPGGLLYVALGDSAAQGIGASRPDRGYVGVLAQWLREATGRPVQVVNLSESRARIDDVLARQVPRLDGLAPDLVTVAVGGNDVHRYDQGTFAEHAAALTAALPEGTVIADVPYFMHGRWQRDAEAAARTLAGSAREHGLVVAPLHETQRAEGWSAMFTQFAADWFHPNDRGHRVWARAFWQAMTVAGVVHRLSSGARGPTRRTLWHSG